MVRDEKVLTPEEARGLHEGDHVYLLAPQEKAAALDRFFADLPPPSSPDPQLLGDFFVGGDATLGALAEIYGMTVEPAQRRLRWPICSRGASAGRRIPATACAWAMLRWWCIA